ncbi:MAG TPA: IS110 family transposase [Sphingobacteriaceae bacterium]|nr:IS110 family transposase [Sphingobacteriaceae bacterium]
MLKYSVGLDVSAKEIHCCLSAIDSTQKVTVKASRKISNTPKGFKDLKEWIALKRKGTETSLVICMEATGVYYENCAIYLYREGFSVSVILPNYAKKYLQASGLKSKNDKTDAKGLAQMGAEKSLEIWEPMGEFFYELRLITREIERTMERRTAITNQIHALNHGMYQNKEVNKLLRAQLKQLEKHLEELDKLNLKHIASNKEVADKVEKLCTIKGVGIRTVSTILAETNGFLLFKNSRQLVSFSGYDVVENQSGTHNGKTRISKKGNSHIRRILHLPAFSVVRWKVKPFEDLYERTLAKHGIKMKSFVAVQKKLLILIYSLWKKDEAYNAIQEKHYTEQEAELSLGSEAIADGDAVKEFIKIVPTMMPALHKVSMTSEQSPYASSRVEQS